MMFKGVVMSTFTCYSLILLFAHGVTSIVGSSRALNVNSMVSTYDKAFDECNHIGGCLSILLAPMTSIAPTMAQIPMTETFWIYGVCKLGKSKCSVVEYTFIDGAIVNVSKPTFDDCKDKHKSICAMDRGKGVDRANQYSCPPVTPRTTPMTSLFPMTNSSIDSTVTPTRATNASMTSFTERSSTATTVANTTSIMDLNVSTKAAIASMTSPVDTTSAITTAATTTVSIVGINVYTKAAIATITPHADNLSKTTTATVVSTAIRFGNKSLSPPTASLTVTVASSNGDTTSSSVSPALTEASHEAPWIHLGYRDYYVNQIGLTHDIAEQVCCSLNATLTFFADAGHYFTLPVELRIQSQKYWIGVGTRTTSGLCLYMKVGENNNNNNSKGYINNSSSNTVIGITDCSEPLYSICSRPCTSLAEHLLNDAKFQERLQDMKIDAKTTKSSRRRLSSYSDVRPTARAVGSVGVAVLLVIGAAIVFVDLTRVGKCTKCRRSKRISSL